jgi:hypothetical protein
MSNQTPLADDDNLSAIPPSPVRETEHVYEVRPRNDKRGVDLISDVLPFSSLWYGEPDAIRNAIGYSKFTAVHMIPWFAFTIPLSKWK